MPPKNKQIIPEWNQCIHCSRILGYRDLSKHKDECLSNKSFSHGYVLHNIFNAVVCPLPEGKGGNIDLPVQMKKDLILMNPSAMQLCGFYIGGLCVLNKTHIRTCWPCSSVGLSSVAISDSTEGVRQGELVSLELFIDPLQHAVEVTLMSSECSPMFKDEMFLQFLSRCKGKFLRSFCC
ncbi:uncharacterized protein LOC132736497 [Ruditapes philippinarum]|uniref:uncharacterized protein LOC132736497 n=1 Tax=Ruditapes philippinarum TaxID=129788 RepID=UPI00295B1E17|nr:uncharacterized protein LOC132736497 [Ruditapes philippinarum]